MDIALGLVAAVACVAAALGCIVVGRRAGKRLGPRAADAVAGLSLLVTMGLVALVNFRPTALPMALLDSPVIYVEFAYYLPTTALFLGIASSRIPKQETGRALAGLALVVAVNSAVHVYLAFEARTRDMLSPVPPPGPVAVQTTGWSCGAAACVTLLKAHDIESTEQEMGEYCLTYRSRGTSLPRFIRGLTRKLRDVDSDLDVRVEEGLTLDELDAFPMPCLVSLNLAPFLDHASVVLEKLPSGDYVMGDPMDGVPTVVERAVLEKRFQGEAIALVPR